MIGSSVMYRVIMQVETRNDPKIHAQRGLFVRTFRPSVWLAF